MGNDVSFELAFKTQDVQALMRALAEMLVPEQREQLLACLPWRPAALREDRFSPASSLTRLQQGIYGFEDLLLSVSTPHDPTYALTFCSPEYEDEPEEGLDTPARIQDGCLIFGGIWTDVWLDEKFGLLTFFSAAQDNNRWFWDEKIQTWLKNHLGRYALYLFLDMSFPEKNFLLPNRSTVDLRIDWDDIYWERLYMFPDQYVPYVLSCI